MHNGLPADASRPGLQVWSDILLDTIKNVACNTENKKIIYISQYFPVFPTLRVLDRAVFPGKYRPGNTAPVFPGQHWCVPTTLMINNDNMSLGMYNSLENLIMILIKI